MATLTKTKKYGYGIRKVSLGCLDRKMFLLSSALSSGNKQCGICGEKFALLNDTKISILITRRSNIAICNKHALELVRRGVPAVEEKINISSVTFSGN